MSGILLMRTDQGDGLTINLPLALAENARCGDVSDYEAMVAAL